MEDEEEAMNELSRQMLEIKQDNEQIQMVAAEMERLENNIHEVNEIFTDLAQIVHAQGNNVWCTQNYSLFVSSNKSIDRLVVVDGWSMIIDNI